MGTALLTTLNGSAEAGAMIIAVVVPIYNIFAVVVLSRYGGGARVSVSDMLFNIIKNPLIIGIVLGVPFSLLQIEIPVSPPRRWAIFPKWPSRWRLSPWARASASTTYLHRFPCGRPPSNW